MEESVAINLQTQKKRDQNQTSLSMAVIAIVDVDDHLPEWPTIPRHSQNRRPSAVGPVGDATLSTELPISPYHEEHPVR